MNNIEIRTDSDGIQRPHQLKRTHEQNVIHFQSSYDVIDRGFETPCWEWNESRTKQGYGVFSVDGRHMKAHRFSLLINVGNPPIGKPLALHRCNNFPCVRPDHLYWGDKKDNWRDAKEAGVLVGSRGEDHPKCKLTEELVVKIRADHASGVGDRKTLAKMYGVDESTIRCIVKRKTWKHVQ